MDYISENKSLFERDVRGRIVEDGKKIKNFDEECALFLSDLSKQGFWGGSESLKAVSLLYKANILIFNENGHFYFTNDAKITNDQSVIISFRCASGNVDAVRDHYDSVCEIRLNDIYICAKELLKRYMKSFSFKQNFANPDYVVVVE